MLGVRMENAFFDCIAYALLALGISLFVGFRVPTTSTLSAPLMVVAMVAGIVAGFNLMTAIFGTTITDLYPFKVKKEEVPYLISFVAAGVLIPLLLQGFISASRKKRYANDNEPGE